MELTAIKVKISSNLGKCVYPAFNQLDVVKQSGMDWSQYVDVLGSGWLYDNKCGHAEVDTESPRGIWWGMLLIPEAFAVEAVAAFPNEVTRLTKTKCKAFYDTRHAVKLPTEEIDSTILQGIKLKQDLGLTLTAEQQKALDPNDDTPGIRKNRKKKWVDYKQLTDVTIK